MELKSPIGDNITASVMSFSSSHYLAQYTPTQLTRGHCQLIVNGIKVCEDPISVFVECPPHQLQDPMHIIENVIKDRSCLKVIIMCFVSPDHSLESRVPFTLRVAIYTLLFNSQQIAGYSTGLPMKFEIKFSIHQ